MKIKHRKTKYDSEFLEWFELQAGKPLSTDGEYYDLKEKLNQLESNIFQVKNLIQKIDNYNLAKKYALYAWMARPK